MQDYFFLMTLQKMKLKHFMSKKLNFIFKEKITSSKS